MTQPKKTESTKSLLKPIFKVLTKEISEEHKMLVNHYRTTTGKLPLFDMGE